MSPGTSITGFPPGTVLGDTHTTDAHASQAQSDLGIAYNSAASQASDASISDDLGGSTLLAGVYTASSSIGVTGTLTLDAEGDPDAVFIFQIGSTLITAPNSTISLLNGAQSCNVFWQVASSATLDTNTQFVGTIMALTSITANNGTTVDGRALARNGSVTLDTNTFTNSVCEDTPPVTLSANWRGFSDAQWRPPLPRTRGGGSDALRVRKAIPIRLPGLATLTPVDPPGSIRAVSPSGAVPMPTAPLTLSCQ